MSPDIVWQMQREGKLRIETAPGTDYAYVALNLRDPILQRVEVRQAIGYAIDRDAIVKYLRRGLRRDRRSESCRRCRGRFGARCSNFRYDPAEAKRLLDARRAIRIRTATVRGRGWRSR